MYRGCIFDLDGTLLDTVESIAWAGNSLLEAYGLKALPIDNYRFYAGDGADLLVERIFQEAGGSKELLAEAKEKYRKIFGADPLHRVKHFPGMLELLYKLKNQGISLAVCTNKPHQPAQEVVKAMFGEGLFQVIQGQEEGIPRKPNPAGPLLAAGQMGLKAEECLYIGDTSTDMKTGKRAGMFTVGVLWGFRDREELERYKADRIIAAAEEILELVKENTTVEDS